MSRRKVELCIDANTVPKFQEIMKRATNKTEEGVIMTALMALGVSAYQRDPGIAGAMIENRLKVRARYPSKTSEPKRSKKVVKIVKTQRKDKDPKDMRPMPVPPDPPPPPPPPPPGYKW